MVDDSFTKPQIYEERGEKSKANKNLQEIEPKDHSPNLNSEEWKLLLKDERVFDSDAQKLLIQFAKNVNLDKCNNGKDKIEKIARKVFSRTVCKLSFEQKGFIKWATVLCKECERDGVWKLRDELVKAMEETGWIDN